MKPRLPGSVLSEAWRGVPGTKKMMMLGVVLVIVGVLAPEILTADVTIASATQRVSLRHLQGMCITGFGNINASMYVKEVSENPCRTTSIFLILSYGIAAAGFAVFVHSYRISRYE